MTDSDPEEVKNNATGVAAPAKKRRHKEYEVVAVLDHRVVDGMTQYLVHWLGYLASEATWEDASHLIKAKETVLDYWKGRVQQRMDQDDFGRNDCSMSVCIISSLLCINERASRFREGGLTDDCAVCRLMSHLIVVLPCG